MLGRVGVEVAEMASYPAQFQAPLLEGTIAAGLHLPGLSRWVEWRRRCACSRLGPQEPCAVLLLLSPLCQCKAIGKACVHDTAPVACSPSDCVEGTALFPSPKVGRSMGRRLLSVSGHWGLASVCYCSWHCLPQCLEGTARPGACRAQV